MIAHDSHILEVKRESHILAQPLAEHDSRVLGVKHGSHALAQKRVVRFPATVAFERECCVLKQRCVDRVAKCEHRVLEQRQTVRFPATMASQRECRVSLSEHEHHVWCIQCCLPFLFVDGELDVFVDDQQYTLLVKVVANPLQIEFAQCRSKP